MRIPDAEDDLAAPQLGQLATLAVDEGLSEVLERSKRHGLRGHETGDGILGMVSLDVNPDKSGRKGEHVMMNLMRTLSLLVAMIPALATAASVELAAFADKLFCEKVAALFGEDLDLNTELSKRVQWEPVTLKGQGPPTRRCSSFDRTRMDLDNDGQEDLVVKATFCLKGAPGDSFYVFPIDSTVLEQASWQDLSPLLATPNKFERTGGTYPLTVLRIDKALTPPILKTSFLLQPFILDSRSYISMTDTRREWMIIATYRGGEQFEDLCYLHAGKF
jgi:hypothetical protein